MRARVALCVLAALPPTAGGGAGSDCEATFLGPAIGSVVVSERTGGAGTPCRVSMNMVAKACASHGAECLEYLKKRAEGRTSAFWTGFGPQPDARGAAAALQLPPEPLVAICVAGVARTFTRPVVHESWPNFLDALAPAPRRKLFLYLKLEDAKVAADKQHTHDVAISLSGAEQVEPALRALRRAGETIAGLEIDRGDRQHPVNEQCPLLATDGASPYTTPPQHLLSSLSSLQRCFALVERYEKETGQRFDLVAYQRPDLTWVKPFPLRVPGSPHSRAAVARGDRSSPAATMKDEIALSCPKPHDALSRGVLCDVATVVPRHHADLYFKRYDAYYACRSPSIYCLAIAYDFGLPAAFAKQHAAVRFVDAPAVIVRSEGVSEWARNVCQARQDATHLTTEQCLAAIYEEGGRGPPTLAASGPWWAPAVGAPESGPHHLFAALHRDFRSHMALWLAWVLCLALVCMASVWSRRVTRWCRFCRRVSLRVQKSPDRLMPAGSRSFV